MATKYQVEDGPVCSQQLLPHGGVDGLVLHAGQEGPGRLVSPLQGEQTECGDAGGEARQLGPPHGLQPVKECVHSDRGVYLPAPGPLQLGPAEGQQVALRLVDLGCSADRPAHRQPAPRQK